MENAIKSIVIDTTASELAEILRSASKRNSQGAAGWEKHNVLGASRLPFLGIGLGLAFV